MQAFRVGILILVLLTGPMLAGCLGGSTGPSRDPVTDNETSRDRTNGTVDHPGSDRPHVHDRWDGETQRTLMDDTVEMEPPLDPLDPFAPAAWLIAPRVAFGLPDGAVVPPGTERLGIDVTWSPEYPIAPDATGDPDRVAVEYKATNQARFREAGDIVGAYGSVNVTNLTVAMADPGHAQASSWRFRLVHPLARPDARVLGTSFHVTITAYRQEGPLPTEPPHPEWWSNGSVVTLYEDSGSREEIGTTPHWGYAPHAVSLDDPGLADPDRGRINGTDHTMIPYGTKQLVAKVNWSSSSPLDPVSDPVPYLHYRWRTGYEEQRTRWAAEEIGDGRAVFVLPVTDEMVDGIYPRERSRWTFQWYFAGQDTGLESPPRGDPVTRPYAFDGDWSIRIAAYNATELPESVLG